ncbi:MAG: ATP-binding cassette domain-containing protein [Oscillospiraceae bacterium]|jgi:peptide/nickel transport system ATP-binding protein|nr:ATP-binding cassette domain-containing protein [Oscillospiraceae bacterium]
MSTIMEVRNLKKVFKTRSGLLHAVDGVSFGIERGTTLGVVGESGCGKSTLGRMLVHLLESTSGQILFDGQDVTTVNRKQLAALRSDVQLIFQDPYSSLNARMMVSKTIAEPLVIRGGLSNAELNERVESLMETVGLDRRFMNAYPHEMDGGRRQRVGIARALALEPRFIVCDEPVSALDVSIQAQILNLMQDLQEKRGLTYVFITHALSVVKYIADENMVMYLGQVVEKCPSDELFGNTLHPYSQALLSAIPIPDIHAQQERIILKGEITSPINPKPGCRFMARCPHATDACAQPQTLREVSPGHWVSCCHVS